jgi:hypothetical protein
MEFAVEAQKLLAISLEGAWDRKVAGFRLQVSEFQDQQERKNKRINQFMLTVHNLHASIEDKKI